MMRTSIVIAAAALVLASDLDSAQDFSLRESEMRRTFTELQAVEVEDFDTDVAPHVSALLPEYKHQLRDLFAAVLGRAPGASPSDLKHLFEQAITHAGVVIRDPNQNAVPAHPYGIVDAIDVRTARDALVASITLDIPCGDDTSLYVFERTEGSWRRTLDVESNGYETIAGARGGSEWALGGGPAPGQWFLVAADVNPWCTSNWQQLRWKVLRPGSSADRPVVMDTGHGTIFLGRDEGFRLSTNARGFRLVWWGSDGLDAGLLVRPHVANFTVIDDRVVRAHPVAFRPEDFVDEWSQTSWDRASEWTAAAAQQSGRRWHAVVDANRGESSYMTSFEFVQPCPQRSTWQVGVSFEAIGKATRLPPNIPASLYFTVSQRDTRFEMMRVGPTRLAGCPGRARPLPETYALPK